MNLHKLLLLFAILIFVGCNQSDSNSEAQPENQEKSISEQPASKTNQNDSSANTTQERDGKVLARVNGQPIYEDELNGRSLETVISDEILYQQGVNQGTNQQFQEQVRDFEKKLVVNFEKQQILENAEPTKEISDEQIQNYYDSNRVRYSHIRIHEINFSDEGLGSEIKDKVNSGEELQAIADSYPDSGTDVNDMGFNREMVTLISPKEVGSVSEVIEKPDGTFSVLKIVEIKEIPINTVKRSIKQFLSARQKGQMIDDHAQKVADENNMSIEIIEVDGE